MNEIIVNIYILIAIGVAIAFMVNIPSANEKAGFFVWFPCSIFLGLFWIITISALITLNLLRSK